MDSQASSRHLWKLQRPIGDPVVVIGHLRDVRQLEVVLGKGRRGKDRRVVPLAFREAREGRRRSLGGRHTGEDDPPIRATNNESASHELHRRNSSARNTTPTERIDLPKLPLSMSALSSG